MLKFRNTENLTGVTISGTFEDLQETYEAIERVMGPGLSDDLTSLRVLGVCYDLRHCFMGNREVEAVDNNYHEDLQKWHSLIHPQSNIHYSVNILWLELMFATLTLDGYIWKYSDDKMYRKMMRESSIVDDREFYDNTRFEDIALVRLFQEKVWNAFRRACGDAACNRLYKQSKTAVETRYSSYGMLSYYTQYIDTLEMKYLKAKPEKRNKLLATLVKKMIVKGDDYYELEARILHFILESGACAEDVQLADVEYPEEIIW